MVKTTSALDYLWLDHKFLDEKALNFHVIVLPRALSPVGEHVQWIEFFTFVHIIEISAVDDSLVFYPTYS